MPEAVPNLDNVDRSKFVCFFDGDFFPVTNMYEFDGKPTTDPSRAFTAVIYAGPKNWIAARVSPGEIEKRELVEARLKVKLNGGSNELVSWNNSEAGRVGPRSS